MKTQYELLGVVEEGRCDRCGTACPRRRVAVRSSETGQVDRIGVDCAALLLHGGKSQRLRNTVVAAAAAAERHREHDRASRIRRVVRLGYTASLPILQTNGVYYPFLLPPATPENLKDVTNRVYRATGRPLEGSFFAAGPDGSLVRIDAQDGQDWLFFEALGFSRVS